MTDEMKCTPKQLGPVHVGNDYVRILATDDSHTDDFAVELYDEDAEELAAEIRLRYNAHEELVHGITAAINQLRLMPNDEHFKNALATCQEALAKARVES